MSHAVQVTGFGVRTAFVAGVEALRAECALSWALADRRAD